MRPSLLPLLLCLSCAWPGWAQETDTTLAQLADQLLDRHFDKARATLAACRDKGTKLPEGLAAQAEATTALPELLLESLRRDQQAGKPLTIVLNSGPELLRLESVAANGSIKAKRQVRMDSGASGWLTRDFRLDDLQPGEKLRRLGDGQTPELNLMRGLLAVEAGRPEQAAKFFADAGPPLGELLASRLAKGAEPGGSADNPAGGFARETAALAAYLELLTMMGIKPGLSPAETGLAIRRLDLSGEQIRALQRRLQTFRRDFTGTVVGELARPVLAVTDLLRPHLPLKVSPPAVEAAMSRLLVDNPGVKVRPQCREEEDGWTVTLPPDPLLKNVSALSTLPIRSLSLRGTGVTDLAPLQNLPLVYLDLCYVQVKTLEPLKNMPLRVLNLDGGVPATDLGALQKTPVEELVLAYSPRFDEKSFRGLKLRKLGYWSVPDAKGLAALRGQPLKELMLSGSFESLDGLEGMPLESLTVIKCKHLRDIAAIRNCPLKTLTLQECPLVDLSPLAARLNQIKIVR